MREPFIFHYVQFKHAWVQGRVIFAFAHLHANIEPEWATPFLLV